MPPSPPIYCFISYRRGDASWQARKLRSFLKSFRPPKDALPGGERRRIVVLFDKTHERATTDLGQMLETRLEKTDHLIVLQSPSWADRRGEDQNWVEKEVEYYSTLGRTTVYVMVTAGPVDGPKLPVLERLFPRMLGLDLTLWLRWLPWWWGNRESLLSLVATVHNIADGQMDRLRDKWKRAWAVWVAFRALEASAVVFGVALLWLGVLTLVNSQLRRQATEVNVLVAATFTSRGDAEPLDYDLALGALVDTWERAVAFDTHVPFFDVDAGALGEAVDAIYAAAAVPIRPAGRVDVSNPGVTPGRRLALGTSDGVWVSSGSPDRPDRITHYRGVREVGSIQVQMRLADWAVVGSPIGDSLVLVYQDALETWTMTGPTGQLLSHCRIAIPETFDRQYALAASSPRVAILAPDDLYVIDNDAEACGVRPLGLPPIVGRSQRALALDPSGLVVAVAVGTRVRLVGADAGCGPAAPCEFGPWAHLPTAAELRGVTFSPDGRYLLALQDCCATIWSVEALKLGEARPGGLAQVRIPAGNATVRVTGGVQFLDRGRIMGVHTRELSPPGSGLGDVWRFFSLPDGAPVGRPMRDAGALVARGSRVGVLRGHALDHFEVTQGFPATGSRWVLQDLVLDARTSGDRLLLLRDTSRRERRSRDLDLCRPIQVASERVVPAARPLPPCAPIPCFPFRATPRRVSA